MGTIEIPKPSVASAGANGRFSWITDNLRSHVREYGPTFATEFAVLASQIVTYKLAAHFLGRQGFAEYALARRTVTLIFPIPVLGLAVGLPRYIGFSKGRNDPEAADRYFGATLRCAGIAAVLCAVLLNAFAGTFGYLFFGDRRYGSLAFPASLMILGLCAHTVACGYFRGHMQMNRANVAQAVNLALAPLCVFFFFRHSLRDLLTGMGAVWLTTSAIALSCTPWRSMFRSGWSEMSELFKYGIQRVPGDFILMALFTLPATVVAHRYGVEQAGFVAFGVSVVSMIGGVFAPVGLVLLPKATWMLAEGADRELQTHLLQIIRITLVGAAMAVLGVWTTAPIMIRLYLGGGFEQVIPVVRIVVLAALPFCLYLVFRNLVDAYHEHGVTAAILAGGLAVFGVGLYAAPRFISGIDAILLDFVVAMVIIATLSGWECRRILGRQRVRNESTA